MTIRTYTFELGKYVHILCIYKQVGHYYKNPISDNLQYYFKILNNGFLHFSN